VLDEHRTTTMPTLKSGQPGKKKVTYGEPEDALKWLWKFVDGAKSAGELYGRTLVVFACQHKTFDGSAEPDRCAQPIRLGAGRAAARSAPTRAPCAPSSR
jgi:hypothetical protein